MKEQLSTQLELCVGKVCWAVVAGNGNGSMVTLHAGGQVKRRMRLSGDAEDEGVNMYKGEYCLFIQGCSWRILDGMKVIGGWREPERLIEMHMSRLAGLRITQIELLDNTFDLNVCFDDRFHMQLFCDQASDDDSMNNYSFRSPVGTFVIGSRGEIEMEAANHC